MLTPHRSEPLPRQADVHPQASRTPRQEIAPAHIRKQADARLRTQPSQHKEYTRKVRYFWHGEFGVVRHHSECAVHGDANSASHDDALQNLPQRMDE